MTCSKAARGEGTRGNTARQMLPRKLRILASFGQRACEQRVRVAGKAADRPQRHVADDAGDAEILIVDQRAGEFLVGCEIGANEARHVIDGAADLPALDDVVDGGEALLEPAAI